MLRFLALAGGAYALYRRFQGKRNENEPDPLPPADPVADQTADVADNPAKPVPREPKKK